MSQVQLEGFVSIVNGRKGTSKNGRAYTLYSFKIEDVEGNEDNRWVGMGFKEPPFKKGDYIRFTGSVNDRGNLDYVEGTGQIVANPPQRVAASGGSNKGSGSSKATESELFGSIGGYNTEDDISRMTWAGSRRDAIEVVKLLLETDALPITKTKGKANEAVRFDEVLDAIDKQTVEYYMDSATRRKLTTVDDAGVIDTRPDAPVPDPVEDEPEENVQAAPPPPAQEDAGNVRF